MNVFDFDNTIYRGDSTRDFVLYCMRRHPLALCYVPCIAYYAIRYYLFHDGTKTEFKERMYTFLRACHGEKDVELFWQSHIQRIKPFYRRMHRSDDVIISASPEFLLKPLERLLDITVIASKVDINTGRYDGLNCYHEEKVRRFYRQYGPDQQVDGFYSDSYSDEPMALLARRAYIVRGQTIVDWDFNKHKQNLRT